jgi:hypothetical protein
VSNSHADRRDLAVPKVGKAATTLEMAQHLWEQSHAKAEPIDQQSQSTIADVSETTAKS